MKKIITKLNTMKNKASWGVNGALAVAAGAALVPAEALAAKDTSSGITGYGNGQTTSGMADMTNGLIGQIAALMTYVGAVVLAVGIIQVIMAFKNEDADGKTRGMLVAVTGIALIAIDSILKAIIPGYGA